MSTTHLLGNRTKNEDVLSRPGIEIGSWWKESEKGKVLRLLGHIMRKQGSENVVVTRKTEYNGGRGRARLAVSKMEIVTSTGGRREWKPCSPMSELDTTCT